MPVKRHYTVAEVAESLRVTPFWAIKLCRDGKIPGAYKPLGQWLIDADQFDAWIASQTEAAS